MGEEPLAKESCSPPWAPGLRAPRPVTLGGDTPWTPAPDSPSSRPR